MTDGDKARAVEEALSGKQRCRACGDLYDPTFIGRRRFTCSPVCHKAYMRMLHGYPSYY